MKRQRSINDDKTLFRASGDRVAMQQCDDKFKKNLLKYQKICAKAGLDPDYSRMRGTSYTDSDFKKVIGREYKKGETVQADFVKIRANDGLKNSENRGIIKLSTEEHSRVLFGRDAIRVDADYINSEAYRMKYHGIAGNSVVDDRIYETAKRMLEHRSETLGEDLALIDMDTGKCLLYLQSASKENSVIYTDAVDKTIKQANKDNIRMIAMHNHPEGYPPTAEDGRSALRHNYTLGIVCGHNGEVYTYTRTKENYSDDICEEVHNWINEEYSRGKSLDTSWMDGLKLLGMRYERR